MLYQILPKKTLSFSAEKTIMMLKSVAERVEKKGWFTRLFTDFSYAYIIDCNEEGKLSFYFEVRTDNAESILNTLNVWVGNDADVFQVEPLKKYDTVNTLYKIEGTDKKILTYSNESIFQNILGSMIPRTRISIDFQISNVSLMGNRSFSLRGVSSDIEIECLIRVFGHTKYSRNIVRELSHKMANLTAGEEILRIDYKDSWKTFKVSGTEIMNILQLPTLYRKEADFLERIHYLRPGQTTLKNDQFSKGIMFGELYHPIQKDREVRISEEVLRKHMIITGTTGAGKSSVIEVFIEDILRKKVNGQKDVPGFTFFDPAETSVLGVLDKIRKIESEGYDISGLMEKVLYVDLLHEDYIFPISLLNKKINATDVLSFLKSLFSDQNAIQVERLLNSSINALLQDDQEYSIFDVEKIFRDEDFREHLACKLSNDMYAQSEVSFLRGKFQANMVDPILNRLDPFGNSKHKKLMFSMTSKYDAVKNIRKWMDEGYIILFNIKGMNQFDINTIVGYYALQSYRTALYRPEHSLLHMLIVEESHKVQLPIFKKITAETRKQGLSLVLATQQMEQFEPMYLKEFLGNLNTIISFRQNEENAARNVKKFIIDPIELQDFKMLPDLIGYISTEDIDKNKRSVLVKVKPPYRYNDGKLVDYKSPLEVENNLQANRKFAEEIMKQHLMTKEEAECIVFSEYLENEEMDHYEKELLEQGDSLLSVEKGSEIPWDE